VAGFLAKEFPGTPRAVQRSAPASSRQPEEHQRPQARSGL